MRVAKYSLDQLGSIDCKDWKNEDKQWLKERKILWNKFYHPLLKKIYKNFYFGKSSEIKYLKRYFLFGDAQYEELTQTTILFFMLLHAKPSIENWEKLCEILCSAFSPNNVQTVVRKIDVVMHPYQYVEGFPEYEDLIYEQTCLLLDFFWVGVSSNWSSIMSKLSEGRESKKKKALLSFENIISATKKDPVGRFNLLYFDKLNLIPLATDNALHLDEQGWIREKMLFNLFMVCHAYDREILKGLEFQNVKNDFKNWEDIGHVTRVHEFCLTFDVVNDAEPQREKWKDEFLEKLFNTPNLPDDVHDIWQKTKIEYTQWVNNPRPLIDELTSS